MKVKSQKGVEYDLSPNKAKYLVDNKKFEYIDKPAKKIEPELSIEPEKPKRGRPQKKD